MPLATSFSDTRAQTAATVLSGTSTTGEIDLGGTVLVGIQLAATMTSTTVTFTMATALGGTYQQVIDGAGAAISKTIASGKYLPIDPIFFRGIRFLKVITGSSEGADRALTIISKPNL